MNNKWNCIQPSPQALDILCSELSIPPILATMLVKRGFEDPDSARDFLEPSLDSLHDPGLMKGVREAVRRIFQAKNSGEKILIYGDYDVDGITSVAVLMRALQILGMNPAYYIPRRLEDGYGLKKEPLQRIADEGFRLVITVDCGIRAIECAEFAGEIGLDLIITDHHLPLDQSPPAAAVIKPKRQDCFYPDKDLPGVGVVFKLVQALFEEAGRDDLLPHFLKMVAIGTVADMVPLTGENRVITHFGLKGLSDPRNPGLKALLDASGIGPEVSSQDISFRLAPRINAYTRMGGGKEIVNLFFSRDPGEINRLVADMNQKNDDRKQYELRIIGEIEAGLAEDPVASEDNFLVFYGRDWHRGVIGNAASRMAKRFHRPCLVISVGEDSCQGSGRSIAGFHLLDALSSCQDLLVRYGGHAQAVGCSLEGGDVEGIRQLEKRLDEYAASALTEAMKTPVLEIDAFISLNQVGMELCRQVQMLEPFGMSNPEPVFGSKNVQVSDGPVLINERHLKMEAMALDGPLDMLWWQHSSIPEHLETGSGIDVAYNLKVDRFRNVTKVYMSIRDLKTFQF